MIYRYCSRKASFGCYIGIHVVGGLSYADAIVLVASFATALRKMLAVCEDYERMNTARVSMQQNLNAQLSCLFVVAHQLKNFKVVFCTFAVNMQSHFCITVTFTSEFNDDEDIINGRSNFVRHTNNYLRYFGKLYPFIQYKLLQAYCTSLLWLWTLAINQLPYWCFGRLAWRKLCVEFGIYYLVRIVNNYHLFVNVYHYPMSIVVDHLTLLAHVLFTICCWSVLLRILVQYMFAASQF